MILSRFTKAALLAVTFAAAPVAAQGEPHDPLPGEADVLRNMGKAASGSYDVAIDNNMDVIGPFMHQQAGDYPWSAEEQATGWIDWSVDTIATSAEYAGAWIAARSNDAATVGQDAYEWLSARSSFMAAAAYDASEWVSDTSQDVVESAQDATDWIAAETTIAAHAATGTVNETLDGLWILEDWSNEFLDEVKKKLKEDKTSEFAKLVTESGFVISNVVVGVGLIPTLDVEFRHERDLTPEEHAEFKKLVDAYAEKTSGLIGYLETILLRNLARAGQLSGGLRIGELHVDLFPFPGLELYFDPFQFEKTHEEMIINSDTATRVQTSQIRVLEQRIEKLESELAEARAGVTSR